jgi:L-ribulose-5-phosphate 3-epimerase
VSSHSLLQKLKVKIAFESDLPPQKLRKFIDQLDSENFGINYDIGNSAALGFEPDEEFSHYGSRIINVHVKDRPLGLTTVPLGNGDADFVSVFKNLAGYRYAGNYILQTARSRDGRHDHVLKRYLEQTKAWVQQYES